MRTGLFALFALVLISMVACRTAAPASSAATRHEAAAQRSGLPSNLNVAADPTSIVTAARALMEADANAALVTVDEHGRPRVRSVRAWLSAADSTDPTKPITVWILTRAESRKVDQIRNHSFVTLYFNDDEKITYATLMGTATVLTDPALPRLQPLIDAETKKYFWPSFPDGFAVIEVSANWLEFMSPALPPDKATWRPQAVLFRGE